MDLQKRLKLEQQWHEGEDFARDDSALIVGVYASAVFKEAEAYHMAALGDVNGRHVLDYGCGAGATSAELARRGAHVTGFDISHRRLGDARAALLKTMPGQRIDLLQSSAEQLPFADSAFDAILGKQILHHLQLDIATAELARVLKPGGRAVFLEPLIHNPILELYRRLTPHLRSPTERALSMADLRRMAAHFHRWEHREFILLAILPVLVQALLRKRNSSGLAHWVLRLQRMDRRLADAIPWIGRYYWETVIVFEK